jgi:hypothetical protein
MLDNLIAASRSPTLIVVFAGARPTASASTPTTSATPLSHRGAGADLERAFPLATIAPGRCLMGASFGAVAALSTACRYPGFYGRLLAAVGLFAFTDIGEATGAARCSTRWSSS